MKSEFKLPKSAVCLGKILRVAPSRDGDPAAEFWKFWISGNEVYALRRGTGGMAKISFHQSGQTHFRLEGKDLQPLAPSLVFGNGKWLHVFELRFLLTPDANKPKIANLKGRQAYLINVQPEEVLTLNLLVGQTGSAPNIELPHELPDAASVIWRSSLKDQRPVTLIGRLLEMESQHREQIALFRHQIKPTINYSKAPQDPYSELIHVRWDPQGGNIVSVIQMGKDAIRVLSENSEQVSGADIANSPKLIIISPSASISIEAPNGALVGSLSIAGATSEISLSKNAEVKGSLGVATLLMHPDNLKFGEEFRTRRYLCPCAPTIGGQRPQSWDYSVHFYFDGTALKAEISQLSVALRNANFDTPFPNLRHDEEIIMVAPVASLVLLTTPKQIQSSTDLTGSFFLRDSLKM